MLKESNIRPQQYLPCATHAILARALVSSRDGKTTFLYALPTVFWWYSVHTGLCVSTGESAPHARLLLAWRCVKRSDNQTRHQNLFIQTSYGSFPRVDAGGLLAPLDSASVRPFRLTTVSPTLGSFAAGSCCCSGANLACPKVSRKGLPVVSQQMNIWSDFSPVRVSCQTDEFPKRKIQRAGFQIFRNNTCCLDVASLHV